MRLVVGLGNPGQEYVFTRHNMGWLAVDHLVQRHDLGQPVLKFKSEFWRARDYILIKPLTFMNLSGVAVQQVFDFYKMELSDVLIIYDDLALPYGQLRLRAKGSAGGHNGLASVISCLRTLEIPRLRIGIGDAPGNRISRVLGSLNADEMKELPSIVDNVVDAVNAWQALDMEQAISKVNVKKAL